MICTYTKTQLDNYLQQRIQKVKDKNWYIKAAQQFWEYTNGSLSEEIIRSFNLHINDSYTSPKSAVKVIDFVNSFLRQYREFEDYARFNPRPKIDEEEDPDPVVIEDVTGLIHHIEQDTLDPRIDRRALIDTILFLSFTGARPGNAENLTAKQIRTGLRSETQCINVDPDQLKIRKRTYIPIHPQLVSVLERMTEGKADDDLIFNMRPLRGYLANDVLPLKYRSEKAIKIHHLRKFFQQHSAILEMPDVWTNYIMNHRGGRNPVAEKHYHNFQSAVYDKYIKYWGPVVLSQNSSPLTEVDILADIDFDKLYTEPPAPNTEESLLKQIESSLASIKMDRDFIRYLNTLVPPEQRLEVDEFLPIVSDVRERIIIRLEGYQDVIETEEEYNRTFLEQLKKEANYYNDLMLDEERRYYKFRASV
ncbi:hypothetical protein DSECCO2_501810 [anaerobic digester metagenome]